MFWKIAIYLPKIKKTTPRDKPMLTETKIACLRYRFIFSRWPFALAEPISFDKVAVTPPAVTTRAKEYRLITSWKTPMPSIPSIFVSGRRKKAPKHLQIKPLTNKTNAPPPTFLRLIFINSPLLLLTKKPKDKDIVTKKWKISQKI